MSDIAMASIKHKALDSEYGSSILPMEVRGLALSIDGQSLIHGLDISLHAGSLTLLMGPNGAGKSLLLRLLHGVIKPTGGDILCDGQPLNPEHRLKQSMVFQRPVLLRRSVAANLDFVLKLRDGRAIAEQRDKLLEQVGLQHKARQPARRLSGGEQQRLALARVLAMQPQMVFLDEPTANLDPSSTYQIEEIVRKIHKDGVKVVFVGHDLAQAKRLGDEIVFMHDGRVLEQTDAKEFFNHPRTEKARDYLEGRLVF